VCFLPLPLAGEDFDKAGFRDEVKPLILKENAAKLLGLS
jgi:predicted TIM-barrel fold metal-dependent hydrolase